MGTGRTHRAGLADLTNPARSRKAGHIYQPPMDTTQTANSIVDRFLRETWFTEDQFRDGVYLHVNDHVEFTENPYLLETYCDCDIAMYWAFDEVVGQKPNTENEVHMAIWKEAWLIASIRTGAAARNVAYRIDFILSEE
jgi:hypothetical protein